MLSALEVDLEEGKVKVDLSKLYEDIDLAETISNLLGEASGQGGFEESRLASRQTPDMVVW